MRILALPLMLSLFMASSAFAAADEDNDGAAEKPAPMRHVITVQDHDAAVKAEEARQQASQQATATPAPARPAAKDAPVAKAAKPALVPGGSPAPAKATASKQKAKKATLAKVGAPAKKTNGKKPLVARAGKH